MRLFWDRNWNGKITIIGSKDKVPNSRQNAGDPFFGWNSTFECSGASDNVSSYKVKDTVGILITERYQFQKKQMHHSCWKSLKPPWSYPAQGMMLMPTWTCSWPRWLCPMSSCLPLIHPTTTCWRPGRWQTMVSPVFKMQILHLPGVCWCPHCCCWIECSAFPCSTEAFVGCLPR